MATETPYMPPGSLVKARGRDWVVIPSDEDGLVRLRPVDGVDDDAVGVYLPLRNSFWQRSSPWPKYIGQLVKVAPRQIHAPKGQIRAANPTSQSVLEPSGREERTGP